MPLAPKPPASASRLPLLALALASFGIGTTEFVIMGLLPDVAGDLGVTIPQAGLLVTGYALSVAFGSPFLAVATARMDRRKALLVLIGIFILGNLLCALAPNYSLLMAARIITALCHGAFFGLGAVVVIGFAAAFALYAWLPRNMPTPRMQLIHEARSLGSTQVILAMLISVLVSASLFGVFTYITPILENVTLISLHEVTLMLLLFGIGLTAGNFLGGCLGDWKLMPSVIGILALLIPVLSLFSLTSASLVPAAVTIFCWGLLAFALISPLQMRVVNEAAQAPNLASTLNQGAFNLGNAAGAWIGGLALTNGLAYRELPWIGVALAAVAFTLSFLSHRFDVKASVAGAPDALAKQRAMMEGAR